MNRVALRSRRWFDLRRNRKHASAALVKLCGLSQVAVALECDLSLKIGQEVAIDLPCVLSKRAIVAWFDHERCVCEFLVPLRFQDVPRCYIEYTHLAVVD